MIYCAKERYSGALATIITAAAGSPHIETIISIAFFITEIVLNIHAS
jgi:hypothetical protein